MAHVLEIYGFPKATKTDDLRAALTDLNCRHFDVKWVDDNHALAVFSSADAGAVWCGLVDGLLIDGCCFQRLSCE